MMRAPLVPISMPRQRVIAASGAHAALAAAREPGLEDAPLRGLEMQPMLGPALQNILGGLGPFLGQEKAGLTLVEKRAEMLAEIRQSLGLAQKDLGSRAVEPRIMAGAAARAAR